MLETLDYTIRIGSTPTFLYFDLYILLKYTTQVICILPFLEVHVVIYKISGLYHITRS